MWGLLHEWEMSTCAHSSLDRPLAGILKIHRVNASKIQKLLFLSSTQGKYQHLGSIIASVALYLVEVEHLARTPGSK